MDYIWLRRLQCGGLRGKRGATPLWLAQRGVRDTVKAPSPLRFADASTASPQSQSRDASGV
jgi:hypothetical protein